MEEVSSRIYWGIKGYWRRKDYERLDESNHRRKNRMELASLGINKRRKFWKIKIKPRVRNFKFISPRRFFSAIRDAYVKTMLGFANSGYFSGGFSFTGEYFGVADRPSKEYDDKIIIEIYKNLIAQGKLCSKDGALVPVQLAPVPEVTL